MTIKERIEKKVRVFLPEGSQAPIEPDKLAEDQIFALLAWELWKDGLDDDRELDDIYNGLNPLYSTKEKAWHTLKACFGY